MNHIRILLLFCVFWFVGLLSVAAQGMRFSHISSDDGLSQSHITCILEDRHGLIWFGTRNGLCRYNGFSFQTYTHRIEDPCSLPDNFVRYLLEDSQGKIWIGTDKGLCTYNDANNTFEPYKGISSTISSIAETKRGDIYCASAILYKVDRESRTISPMHYNGSSMLVDGVNMIHTDEKDNLWVAGKKGLYVLNGKMQITNEIKVDAFDDKKEVLSFYRDKKKNLWIGKNGGGLIRQDGISGKQELIRQEGGINENMVRVITEDHQGRIWAGTERGLIIVDVKGVVSFVHQNQSNRFSLNDNVVYSIICDRKGNVWVGTYFGGLNLYSITSETIQYYEAGTANTQLKGKAVRQMVEHNGFLWIATEDGGLNQLNLATNEIKQIKLPIVTSNVHSLQVDNKGNLWIGTFMGGLLHYNPESGVSEIFTSSNSRLKSDLVLPLYLDKDGDLWIGTSRGLCYINSETGEIEQMESEILHDSFVYSLTGDEKGNIWIGSRYKGLICYEKQTGKITQYSENADEGYLSDNYISSLMYDSKGHLWVGTNNGGLYQFDKDKQRFESFLLSKKLDENCIYGITEDKNGRIWVIAGRHIYYQHQDSEGFVQMYGVNDLPINHFNYNSAYTSSDGKLYFGTVNGLVSLYPTENSEVVYPDVQLIGLTDAKGVVHYVDFYSSVSLESGESSTIGIEFAAIDPSHSTSVVYSYKMEGVDNQWQVITKLQRINYSNLPPGHYRFCVMASSSRNQWDEKNMRIVEITIQPPLYSTWWAYMIYSIVIAAVTFLAIYYYRKRQREKREAFENKVERDKLERLNDMKQKFFTDISHEIKTPLSLIIAPARQMLESQADISAKMKDNLCTILRGSETLRLLVQELVDVNKLNKGQYELTMSKQNPLSMISELAHRYVPLAENKGINFHIEIENWGEEATFSVMAVEKILNNLISNAFKFTPKQGVVELSASLMNRVAMEGRWLQIIVSDTGCGMTEDEREKIFQKFYQADSNGTKTQGWGVGLSVVKQLVESHNGIITVESQYGKGSVFTVILEVTNLRVPVTDGQKQHLSIEESLFVSDELEVNNSHTNTIMVVEDNDDMRHYLRALLSDEYNVVTAVDGIKALEMLNNNMLPDIIISDVMMPDMDGIELCGQIKSNMYMAHIPIILLTAKTGATNAMKGYELGANIYMEKPFSSSMLLMQLKNLLKIKDDNRKEFRKSETADINILATNRYDRQLLEDVQRVVEKNIGNSDFCVNDIINEVGVSRTKLHVKLKSLINMSIGDYIKEVRLRKSKELLLDGYSISDTAYASGFSDPNYFTKCFKKSFGILPRDFVKANNPNVLK